MQVKFTKMHGLGNDYIYFDCIDNPALITNPAETAKKLSDRHFSIGGDGIVLILPHDEADFQMRMFNADGSEAEMCGNAIRCVGKFVYDKGYTNKNSIRVATGAGILELVYDICDNEVAGVRVDMGEPILNGQDIPVTIVANPVIDASISVADGTEYKMTCISVGNPHAVIFVDEITDKQINIDGPQLEVNPIFPRKINVEFAKINSRDDLDMRVWERGSGETMACGTGATATATAAILNKLTNRKVTVHLLGGDLEIEWADNNHLYMTGPATFAFSGEVTI